MLTGFGLAAIMGFSPTVYASCFRPMMYCYVCFAYVIAAALTYIRKDSFRISTHGENNIEKHNSINPVVLYSAFFVAALSYAFNLYGVIVLRYA